MKRTTKPSVKIGQRVAWKTAQGETSGTVAAKLTASTTIKRYRVKASPSQPKLLVRSERTGKEAAHLASSLRPIGRKRAAKGAR